MGLVFADPIEVPIVDSTAELTAANSYPPGQLAAVRAESYALYRSTGLSWAVAVSGSTPWTVPDTFPGTDNAAIAAARDTVGVGGTLLFSNRTYTLTSGLTASVANQTWDLGNAIISHPSATVNAITPTASGFTIKGGTFNGQVASPGGTTMSAIFIGSNLSRIDIIGSRFQDQEGSGIRGAASAGATNYVRVERCYFTNTGKHAVFFNTAIEDSWITDNIIDGTARVDANGIWVGNESLRCHITHNKVNDPGDMGIEVWTNADGATVEANTITNAGTFGISVHASPDSVISMNKVRGFGINAAGGIGIEIVSGSHRCALGGNIVNGLDAANATRGLTINDSDGCSIDGGTISNVDGTAVRLINSPAWTAIDGVTMHDCTTFGVELSSDDTDTSVNGCTIYDCATGIGRSAGNPVRLNIEGCTITDCLTRGIGFLSITDGTISGNTIVATAGTGTGEGIQVGSNASGVTLTGNRVTGYAGAGGDGIHITSTASNVVAVANDVRGNMTGILNQSTTGINLSSNPGYNPVGHAVTQPAVPATTVAQTNTTGVDCMVVVAGGTVTVIAVGGTATGLTSGTFRVPAGQTITLTYSSAPTWQWFGD